MPNPSIIICKKDEWTLVAKNQIFCYLYNMSKNNDKYLYTYRLTGNEGPLKSYEGVNIFDKDSMKFIISLSAIDIYIMALGIDGIVRADWTV